MEITGIKYKGPIFDQSGYGQACRGNILSLHKLGIPITLELLSFEQSHPDLGRHKEVLGGFVNKDIDYNIVICHTTPEHWPNLREEDKINVGYTIWETSKPHLDWPKYINDNVDKVLVGSEWNKEVFGSNGITVPIGVVPHAFDMSELDNVTPYNIEGISENTFVFYSIFQWIERKNPMAYMRNYWHAFQNNEDVALVLKTYRMNYDEKEKESIKTTISRMKKLMPLDTYPKIYFVSNMLSHEEMLGLHAGGDCYLSLDRGEGFGLSPFLAGALGKPIIVTGWGGTTSFANKQNSYLIDYSLTPVWGMPQSPWYRGDQLWAEPRDDHAIRLMRWVYDNRDEAKKRGKVLQHDIETKFSWEVIGETIIREIGAMNV